MGRLVPIHGRKLMKNLAMVLAVSTVAVGAMALWPSAVDRPGDLGG
jgi:hypothetical protein